jgi:ABC-type glycerol-3-phosphate transport system substrate-binding protein
MNVRRIAFTAISSLALAAAVCAAPQQTPSASPDSTKRQSETPAQSAAGKITAFDKTSVTINVTSPSTGPGQHFAQAMPAAKSMTFHIDKNTTVDGTLKVDSNAEVTYRQSNGSNLAISIRVTP